MTANASEFPGFVPDGRPLDDVYEAFLDHAYGVVAPANGNDVTVVWPDGARIGLTRPTRKRDVPNFHVCWRGAGGVGSRSQTRFQALRDLGGHMISHSVVPQAEFTGFTCEALVEQSAGAGFHIADCYQTTVSIDSNNFYRNIQYENASGLWLDGTRTLGGSLLTPNAWDALGRGYKVGSHHILGDTTAAAGSNSVSYNNVTSDPDGDPEANSRYETSWEVKDMDGMWLDKGHCAGGRLAHLRLFPAGGRRVNGIKGIAPWFDAYAMRALQITGVGPVTNVEMTMPTFQTSKQFNVAIENHATSDVHMYGPINEFSQGYGQAAGSWYVGGAKEVHILGGVTKGNGRAEAPTGASIWIDGCSTVRWDQAIHNNNCGFIFYVRDSSNVNLLSKKLRSGWNWAAAGDGGGNIDCDL